MSDDSVTDNPHLIDRYIVSRVSGSKYLVTNGDNSFSIQGKGNADTLCDTLNTKADTILEAMCTLTGDWSGYVKVLEKPDDLDTYLGMKGVYIQGRGGNDYNLVDIRTKKELRQAKEHFEDDFKGCKVVFFHAVLKRLGISEDSEFWG